MIIVVQIILGVLIGLAFSVLRSYTKFKKKSLRRLNKSFKEKEIRVKEMSYDLKILEKINLIKEKFIKIDYINWIKEMENNFESIEKILEVSLDII